jgi:hypothetical protein
MKRLKSESASSSSHSVSDLGQILNTKSTVLYALPLLDNSDLDEISSAIAVLREQRMQSMQDQKDRPTSYY